MLGTDILALHAGTRGDKTALVCGMRRRSFAELHLRTNRLASSLRRLGVKPGDRVSGMSFNSVEGAEVAHATRKLGGIGVPINYRLRKGEVAYILNDSGAAVVLAGPEFVSVVAEAAPDVRGDRIYVAYQPPAPPGWLLYEDLVSGGDANELTAPAPTSLGASMVYTSGTTGNPKGAYRPAGVSAEGLFQVVEVFRLSSDDVHLVCGPGYHSAVAFFSALHQLIGSTVVIQPKFEAAGALALLAEHRVSTTFMAPMLLQRLCELPRESLAQNDTSSLKALILGAAPCSVDLKRRAISLFGPCLWEFYGATETGFNTVLPPEDQLRKPGSCGHLWPGQEIRLVDEDGREVPEGKPGELWVRNPWLAEYYNRPEATAGSMRDGFFSVGDIAYRDADGYYYICDRKADMILSGGVNIYPAEIELVLHEHAAVEDVAVIGVPDPQWGESVLAMVVLKPGASAAEPELIDWVGKRLAGYKKPRSVEFRSELPRDPAGKIIKRLLREPYWEGVRRSR